MSLAVAAGFALPASAGAVTFSNPTPISIPVGAGPGSPSPSSIAVSAVPTPVTSLTATLHGVVEPNPNVIDVLLTGPTGQGVVLMSDACGTDNLNDPGLSLTFADGSPTLPTTTCAGATGSFSPTDAPPAEMSFTGSGITGPYGTALMPLATTPNGIWQLFVRDGGAEIQATNGLIRGGWSLDFQSFGANTAFCAGKASTIRGSDGPDRLIGTPGPDVINAGDGNDSVFGHDGGDLICFGTGEDKGGGGEGRDMMFGGSGNDGSLKGGPGNDEILGQGGGDRLFGQTGQRDRVFGGKRNDKLSGGDGQRDFCDGGAGTDTANDCESQEGIEPG